MPKALIDVQIPAPAVLNVKQLKMWAKSSLFSRMTYLDTDTYVTDARWEIFSVLDNFHLEATVTPYRRIGDYNEKERKFQTAGYLTTLAFPDYASARWRSYNLI